MQAKVELAAAQAGGAPAGPSGYHSGSPIKRQGRPLENGRSPGHAQGAEELAQEPDVDAPTVHLHKTPDSLAGMALSSCMLAYGSDGAHCQTLFAF